ncbi:UvrD-helicase domain-containing protein [Spirochaeta thermophila]|uniref:UvrD-like helicase ATP-binding domain-containing protein n=1 Tax=Winmispira thermophila (strain ATCC 49972 / DSM 6192 / RI 19.B1) TaxID=665571 RepID=E0RT53_WINT6|nr:UvrD-helicase domain-containing protein [Spirochaeta thermophila]ADN02349.1 hypothetical protein STHERM_c14090 [Spirochaeta thermophila DSM 6192]
MRFIADLHTHSRFSRGTSKFLTAQLLDVWARVKGIAVVGTGDCTHPAWRKELAEVLEPAEEGLFVLRREVLPSPAEAGELAFALERPPTRFVLSGEISTIYSAEGSDGRRVRKVHHVVLFPSLEAVERFARALERRGNLASDGRPILGVDSRDLLEMALEACPEVIFVPAHIWTPWFSVLGSKSGFDSIEECYRDLVSEIFAVETGLSSDPPMNWLCSFLDRFTLVSNSDAHSAGNLGREANLFDTELSFTGIREALETRRGFLGTVEFFPEEGKYHLDGHRKCGVCLTPVETLERGGRCPVCGRPLTVGVMNRVVQLADRDRIEPERFPPFYSLVPLDEIVAEIEGKGVQSKAVRGRYLEVVRRLGGELQVLLEVPVEEIARVDGWVAEGVAGMRERRVWVREGFDGQYGVVRVFPEGWRPEGGLFGGDEVPEVPVRPFLGFDPGMLSRVKGESGGAEVRGGGLTGAQREVVEAGREQLCVVAGPGAGKTRVLVGRVARLVEQGEGGITVLAFTRKAAEEIRERLRGVAGGEGVWVGTFHAWAYECLVRFHREAGYGAPPVVLEGDERRVVWEEACRRVGAGRVGLGRVERLKREGRRPEEVEGVVGEVWRVYEGLLAERGACDVDDLLLQAARLIEGVEGVREWVRGQCRWVLVDEAQDLNAAQYGLLVRMAPTGEGVVCMIGDPAQAIYGFRGASAGWMGRFVEEYGARVVRLEESFRCPAEVLEVAEGVLGEGVGRRMRARGGGGRVSAWECASPESEAEFIARQIEQRLGGTTFFSFDSEVVEDEGGVAPEEIGVLCRTHLVMDVLEEAFRNHGIPYRRVGEGVRLSRGARERLARVMGEGGVWEQAAGEVGGGVAREWGLEGEDLRVWEELVGRFPHLPVRELVADCLAGGMEGVEGRKGEVSLLSMHAAKGLEFDVVFIPACEAGLVPFSLFPTEGSDEEEERRLLYVALTRAKREVVLTMARRRTLKGRSLSGVPSPFLAHLPWRPAPLPDRGPRQYTLF